MKLGTKTALERNNYRSRLQERIERETAGMNSYDYCMTFLGMLKQTTDLSIRRSYVLRLQERLVKEPFIYKGKLRNAVRKSIAEGYIQNV